MVGAGVVGAGVVGGHGFEGFEVVSTVGQSKNPQLNVAVVLSHVGPIPNATSESGGITQLQEPHSVGIQLLSFSTLQVVPILNQDRVKQSQK